MSTEKLIISGSEDKTIKLWSQTGACKKTIEGPLDFVRCVLGVKENKVIASTRDFDLACYDIKSS